MPPPASVPKAGMLRRQTSATQIKRGPTPTTTSRTGGARTTATSKVNAPKLSAASMFNLQKMSDCQFVSIQLHSINVTQYNRDLHFIIIIIEKPKCVTQHTTSRMFNHFESAL